jgi:hypothetical protein
MQASCVLAEKLEQSAELGLADADRTHLSPQSFRPEAMASPAVTATHWLESVFGDVSVCPTGHLLTGRNSCVPRYFAAAASQSYWNV